MPIDQVIALSGHIEKLGIIGVLVVVCCVLAYALKHYRDETISLHGKLERAKLAFIVVKQAADAAGVKYDLSSLRDLSDLIGDNGG